MLINFSNHPSNKWDKLQLDCATKNWGNVVDIAFPIVNPKGNEDYINNLAQEYFNKITSYKDVLAVHIMGEQTLCFALITMLKKAHIKCVASTTMRLIEEYKNGIRVSKFIFEKFREY